MNELKQKRKELNITQIQAANACGVSRRTYQTYEETNNLNETYNELLRKLNDMGIIDGSNYISSIKNIKYVCNNLFKEKYPEIKCAFLFGSYAKGKATGNSDIDILIVCPPLNATKHTLVAELEEQLHKQIDLYMHEQLLNDRNLIEEILKDGIKIYG